MQFCWLPLAIFSGDSYFSFSSAVFATLSDTLRLHVPSHPLQPVAALYPAPHLWPVSSESLSAQLLLLCPGCLFALPSHDGVRFTDPWRSLCLSASASLCLVGVTSWEVTSAFFSSLLVKFSISAIIFRLRARFLIPCLPFSLPPHSCFMDMFSQVHESFSFLYVSVLFPP